MKKILTLFFVVSASVAAQAQGRTVEVLGEQYEQRCVQEALKNSCRPTGREFGSDLIRVHGVGSRVGECVAAEIAHCSAAASVAAPATTPNTTPNKNPGGARGRGGRR